MVTPKVVKEVRNHFNCPELEGAELEDQGGEGTVLTHWEKRVFEVRTSICLILIMNIKRCFDHEKFRNQSLHRKYKF